jgi:hypothetical protein
VSITEGMNSEFLLLYQEMHQLVDELWFRLVVRRAKGNKNGAFVEGARQMSKLPRYCAI